ncbi:MAG: retroviral-like aspartic protease family protein [Candidatus Sumerlaeota bacterium]|nr:retroviral-like aspartic protease family protein [Candidatus Sumerlaeota bacterium]
MGLIYADIELINGGDQYLFDVGQLPRKKVRRVKVKALVDSGAYMMAINERIRNQLGLPKKESKTAVLATGKQVKLDVVGPLEIHFKNRQTSCNAMVLPGEAQVLLGAIPMEDLDVVLDQRRRRLTVNPESPYVPKTILM